MSFTIYSIGDVNFLAEIINAVAMLTAVPDFNKLIQIGLLIGVIFVMLQSIFQGAKQINWHQVFLGWILYMAFFIPTTTVTILDSYTATARVISNVPIVIGVAGGVISRIGYGITRMFEQGYGTIEFSMTNRRFADSLQILNKIRRQGTDTRMFEALNKGLPPGADMRKSWYNYMNECVMVKLALGDITLEDMYAKNWYEAFRFQTGIFPTEIYVGGAPQTMLCGAAFTELVAASQNAMNQPAFHAALNRVIGARRLAIVECNAGCRSCNGSGARLRTDCHARTHLPRSGCRALQRYARLRIGHDGQPGADAAQHPVGGGADDVHVGRASYGDVL